MAVAAARLDPDEERQCRLRARKEASERRQREGKLESDRKRTRLESEEERKAELQHQQSIAKVEDEKQHKESRTPKSPSTCSSGVAIGIAVTSIGACLLGGAWCIAKHFGFGFTSHRRLIEAAHQNPVWIVVVSALSLLAIACALCVYLRFYGNDSEEEQQYDIENQYGRP